VFVRRRALPPASSPRLVPPLRVRRLRERSSNASCSRGGSARRLTNTLHLCELLGARAAREPISLGELVRLPDRPHRGDHRPRRRGGQRAAPRGRARRRAAHVDPQVEGARGGPCLPLRRLHAVARSSVRLFERDGKRWLFAGRPGAANLDKALERETEGDDQRLLYVALTRARRTALPCPTPAIRPSKNRRRTRIFWRCERRLSPRPPPPAGALAATEGGGALRIEADRLPDAARRHARAHRRGRTGLAARARRFSRSTSRRPRWPRRAEGTRASC